MSLDITSNDKLKSFASAIVRNKVVFTTEVVNGLEYINVGKRLSEELIDLEEQMARLKAAEILKSLAIQSVHHDKNIGSYIAIYNIGILFEPDLHINTEQFFLSASSDVMLFVACQHTITDNAFLFQNSQDCKINLQSLSYISL